MTPHAATVTVVANGTTTTLPVGMTLGELALRFGLPPKSVLVEHNGTALLRDEWPSRTVAEGDRIEFVRMVAGG